MPLFNLSDSVKYTPSQPVLRMAPLGAVPQASSPSTSDERSDKSSVFLVREMESLGKESDATSSPSAVVVKTVRFWSSRSKLEKVLLCLLGVTLLSLLILVVMFLLSLGTFGK
ncbi:unnamed protein product [Soboliphyme baturini]|uniref:Membrane protein US9 n=1 Tax=Soboliphyme baturini TaxID=241478 RepID=A0A183J118_9BILA|nr:unnamed protein product [Soboliphyme baturini]